jgi:hypothetical protein
MVFTNHYRLGPRGSVYRQISDADQAEGLPDTDLYGALPLPAVWRAQVKALLAKSIRYEDAQWLRRLRRRLFRECRDRLDVDEVDRLWGILMKTRHNEWTVAYIYWRDQPPDGASHQLPPICPLDE